MEIISRKEARERGLKQFLGSPCRHGHIGHRYTSNNVCVSCAIDRARMVYENNREEISAKSRQRRAENPDHARHLELRNRLKNPEKKREKDKRYRDRNKEKISAWHVAHRKKMRASDPVFALKHGIRALVYSAFSRQNYTKNTKTADILGCDWLVLKRHIELQFLPGMTWENRDEWHIDHIVALADAKNEAAVIALNHYTNLRPLWGADNLAKGAKQTHLI